MSVSKSKSRGYLGRSIILLLGAGAVTCSVFAALSCDFIGVKNVSVDSIFENHLYVESIGIYGYNMATIDKCVLYEEQFWKSNYNEFMLTAQFAAIVGPAFGALAWLAVFNELLFCQCRGSFVLQNVLFLLAFITQWSTFFLFGQTEFCFFDGAMKCDWKLGSILSITAGGLYYVCSILLCCMSRPKPCLGDNREDKYTSFSNYKNRLPRDIEEVVTDSGSRDENIPNGV
jgi:hypothetical protein